jgi:hypothetical protein
VCWAGSSALDQREPNVSQERERLVVRLQAPLPVVPSTIPAANSPKMTADASAEATRAAANDRHQGDHRQRRDTHPDHLRRRTEQPDATANIDRHDHPVFMLVAGVRWAGGTSVRDLKLPQTPLWIATPA